MAFWCSPKGTDQNIASFKSIAQWRRLLHRPVPVPTVYLADDAVNRLAFTTLLKTIGLSNQNISQYQLEAAN